MIDSHAHLEMVQFDHDRDQVIARAEREGVHTILSLAMIDEMDSFEKAIPLVETHGLLSAIGCHPHDAKIFDDKGGEAILARCAANPKILANNPI